MSKFLVKFYPVYPCEELTINDLDFAAIEIGKPVWINIKMGDRWALARVLPEFGDKEDKDV